MPPSHTARTSFRTYLALGCPASLLVALTTQLFFPVSPLAPMMDRIRRCQSAERAPLAGGRPLGSSSKLFKEDAEEEQGIAPEPSPTRAPKGSMRGRGAALRSTVASSARSIPSSFASTPGPFGSTASTPPTLVPRLSPHTCLAALRP